MKIKNDNFDELLIVISDYRRSRWMLGERTRTSKGDGESALVSFKRRGRKEGSLDVPPITMMLERRECEREGGREERD